MNNDDTSHPKLYGAMMVARNWLGVGCSRQVTRWEEEPVENDVDVKILKLRIRLQKMHKLETSLAILKDKGEKINCIATCAH